MSERTSAARWRENGDLDPHGSYYDRGRAELMLGDLTDDELANAVFMYGDNTPSITELMNGATMPIVYLTAAKERIRWLSRNLVKQEQQTADLLAALETLYKDYVRVMEAGRDRIRDLGGNCDQIDVMERGDPGLIDARKAIAKAKGGAA